MRKNRFILGSGKRTLIVFFICMLVATTWSAMVGANAQTTTIDVARLYFRGWYSQTSGSITLSIYISTSHQVAGTEQGYTYTSGMTDVNYIDLPTSRVRYGSLTSPGQLVVQHTFTYLLGGESVWSDITSYCASHGLTTYFVAVSNPGADFLFDVGLWLHLSNGTEAYYPYVSTGEFGSSGHSMTRGIAGGAAEITLTPITETETLYNELLTQYNTLQSQHNTLLAQYNTLLVQNSTLTSQYNTLVSQYNSLLSQYNALLSQNTTSASQYNSLLSQYNTLQGQYNAVQDQYSNLQSQYPQLQNLLIAPVILIVLLAISTGYFFSKSRRKP